MHLSTAKWLVQEKSFNKYHLPEKQDLQVCGLAGCGLLFSLYIYKALRPAPVGCPQDPARCMYYCAAYLITLAGSSSCLDATCSPPANEDSTAVGSVPDLEEFVIRAYHAGTHRPTACHNTSAAARQSLL